MFPGVLALLERSLRIDARAWGPHLARFGLMLAILIAVTYAAATNSMFGAPGLRFFRSIAYLNLVFMTLMGIGFFSTSITEEKEEDTLGLMLMAGISPLGILLGKSGGRLIQALLLVAVQYPFTLLAVTLGGVTQDQVQSVYVALFAYLFMLSGVGLFCSTVATRNRSASFRLMVFLFAYFAIPAYFESSMSITNSLAWPFKTVATLIAESCVFLEMGTILTTGFQETMFSSQVVTNVIAGLLGFGFSWAFFGIASKTPTAEADSRGLVSRSRGPFRLFSPGRPLIYPLAWKDFHFVSGGMAATLLRIAIYVSLYFAAIPFAQFMFGSLVTIGDKSVTGCYLVMLMFAIPIDAGLLVSRSLHQEVRGQTLTTLLMLPITTGRILYTKVIGSLLVWLPGPACLWMGMIVLPYGPECVDDFFRSSGAPFWLIAHLILIPHLAALAAMYVRWGALPLAIAATIGSLFLSVSFFQVMRVSDNSGIVFGVGMIVLGICGICHIAVWLQAERLSAR